MLSVLLYRYRLIEAQHALALRFWRQVDTLAKLENRTKLLYLQSRKGLTQLLAKAPAVFSNHLYIAQDQNSNVLALGTSSLSLEECMLSYRMTVCLE